MVSFEQVVMTKETPIVELEDQSHGVTTMKNDSILLSKKIIEEEVRRRTLEEFMLTKK